ncbi:MipA/OmpV family protein [Burkholderia sp. 22PA0099]
MLPRRAIVPSRLTVFAVCCAAAVTARAQTPSPLGEWQYSAGVTLQKVFDPKPPEQWSVRFGAASSFQPRYEGSDQYRVKAGPNFDVRYRDLFFLSTGEGLGVNFAQGQNWRTTLSINYDLGRRSADDLGHLNGLPNINPAPLIKLSGDYVISKNLPIVLRADVRRSIGGSNGWVGDLSAYMPLPGSSEKFFWFAGPTVSFADSNYMNSWFGINQQASTRTGYRPYSAKAGLKSYGVGMTMVWFVRKHWFVTVDGALEQLVGSARNSPLTQRSTNGVADVSVNYQF